MSLKVKIRNTAKQKNIPAQVILQNFMFERLLVRLAASEYKDKFVFSEIFDDEKSYELWAYNIETVMAEKVETILRRGVFNTRPRDFYNAYVLATTQNYDKALFAQALGATANHRGTADQIADVPGILRNIEESLELKAMWEKYCKQFAYAKDIAYEQIVAVIKH
jgi:predicted nucleotidyltransferase component of viral defense system